jgi:hypothetical protein
VCRYLLPTLLDIPSAGTSEGRPLRQPSYAKEEKRLVPYGNKNKPSIETKANPSVCAVRK